MKTFEYSVSTNTIWTGFDNGTVEAENLADAKVKAIAELEYNFQKANDAFDHCDITKGFYIEFDKTQVIIVEKVNQ